MDFGNCRTQENSYSYSYCSSILRIANTHNMQTLSPNCFCDKNVPADFKNSFLGVATIMSYSNAVFKKPEICVKASKCPYLLRLIN